MTWPGLAVGALMGTLLHEVVHMSGMPAGGTPHGPAFGRTLAVLAEKVYDVDAWAGVCGKKGDWRGVQAILDACLTAQHPAKDRPERAAAEAAKFMAWLESSDRAEKDIPEQA